MSQTDDINQPEALLELQVSVDTQADAVSSDALLKKISHTKLTETHSWLEGETLSYRDQYEGLLLTHKETVRSRNQQIKEIQEAYLAVVEDLNHNKNLMQQRQLQYANQLEQLKQQIQLDRDNLESRWQDQVKNLEVELAKEKSANVDLRSSEQNCHQQIQQLNDQIWSLQADVASIKEQKDHTLGLYLEIEALLKSKQEELRIREATIAEQQQTVTNLKDQILQGEACLVEQALAAESKQQILMSEADAVSQRLTEANLNIEKYQAKITEAEQLQQDMQARLDAQASQIVVLQTNLADRDNEIHSLKHKLQEQSARLDSYERTTMRSRELQTVLEQQVVQLNQQNFSLDSDLKNSKQNLELANIENKKLADIVNELNLSVSQKDKNAKLLTDFYLEQERSMEQALQGLSAENSELQLRIKSCIEEKDATEDLVVHTEKQLQQLRILLDQTQDKMMFKQSQLEQAQHTIITSEEEKHNLLQLKDKLYAEQDSLKSEILDLQETLKKLNLKLEEEKVLHAQSENKYKGMRRALIEEKRQSLIYRQNIQSLDTQVLNYQTSEAQYAEQLASSVKATEDLNSKLTVERKQIKDLEAKFASAQLAIENSQQEIYKKSEKIEELSSYLKTANQQVLDADLEKLKLRESIADYELELASYKADIKKLTADMQIQIYENSQIQMQLEQVTVSASAAAKLVRDYENKLQASTLRLQTKEQEHNDLHAQLEKALSEVTYLSENIRSHEEQYIQMLERQTELQNLSAGQVKVEQELRNLLLSKSEAQQMLTQKLNENQDQLTRLKSEVAIYEDRQISLKNQMYEREQLNRSAREELEEECASLKSQVETLRRDLASEQSELVIGKKELQTRKQLLESKEKQLRFFMDSLNTNKQSVKEQISRVLSELQVFKRMNPMADYLKVTLREIKRVEVQLARTPTLSADRAGLEKCMADLVEQREFLTLNLERFQTDFDQRLKKLSVILGGEALTLTPPPPPNTQENLQV